MFIKRLLFFLTALWFSAGPSLGQVMTPKLGDITAATTSVLIELPENTGSVSVNVSGTWSATLQFEGGNGLVFDGVNCNPFPSGAAVTSTTGNDTWFCSVPGLTQFRVRPSAYTSGTAAVIIKPSEAISKGVFNSAPTFSSITPGSILFAGVGGVVSEDNTLFFVDATNRIGLGTNDPTFGGLVSPRVGINATDGQTGIALGNASTPRFAVNGNAAGSFTLYDYGAGSFTAGITQASGSVGIGDATPLEGSLTVLTDINAALYETRTNCADSAGAAACAAAAAGSVVIDAGATSVVVSTTAVTANSQITPTFDSSLGTRLSVTCNVTAALPYITARTAGTSFTITVGAAPITNPACYGYTIVN